MELPSLDEIASDPRRAAELTGKQSRALLSRLVVAMAALTNRSVEDEPPTWAPAKGKMLTPEIVAARLDVSSDWVYRNWRRKLPFGRKIGGNLRFYERGLEEWIKRARDGRAPRENDATLERLRILNKSKQ
jgi:predicted DNA-binding transcriptional regulator AlpA